MHSIQPRKSSLLGTPMYVLLAIALCVFGCQDRPSRIEQPGINASRAGRLAMNEYDTNGDGVVAGDELAQAPGLHAALRTMNTDGDGGISAEELTARIGIWKQIRTGVMSFPFTVTLGGRPLEGADVTFEPEAFLGNEIKPASCRTNYFGGGGATIAKEDRPDPKSPPGMHLGLYKVRISKLVNGQETIPAKYNSETILGQEVAPDVPEILSRRVIYALSTK